MKRIFTILTILSSIFITSCDKDKVDKVDDVSLLIGGISLNTTRAIINTTVLPVNSEIGIQVTTDASDDYYAGLETNGKLKYRLAVLPNTWSEQVPSGFSRFSFTEDVGRVFAYYPYSSSGINGLGPVATIPVILATGNVGTDIDYMYYRPQGEDERLVSKGEGQNEINLKLNHALTKVTFSFYLDSHMENMLYLTKFEVKDAVARNSFIKITDLSMNIADGTIDGGNKGTITRTLSNPFPISSTNVSSPDSFSFLVCPFAGANGDDIALKFVIDKKTYDLLISSDAAFSWEAGNENKYTIKITSEDASISGVTVEDWSDVSADIPVIEK